MAEAGDDVSPEVTEMIRRVILEEVNAFVAKLELTAEEGEFVRMQLGRVRANFVRDEWRQWRDRYGPSFRTVALPAAFAIATKTFELMAKHIDAELKCD